MSTVSVQTEGPHNAAYRLAAAPISDGFLPVALHEWRDPTGRVWRWSIRLKHPDWAKLSDAERDRLQRKHRSSGAKWIRPLYFDGSQYVIAEPPAPATGKPLYCVPATPIAGGDVWVTEGEACADALSRLGLAACTSGGADSARAADWTTLRGCAVRVWPDHDEPGRRYAEEVVAILRAQDGAVQVIDDGALGLSEKGDVVDWLQLHPQATATDVAALPRRPDSSTAIAPAARAVGPRLLLSRGSQVEPVAVQWLWPGWLARGKLHLLGGAPGTAKTTIGLAFAAAVTGGGRWPDGTRASIGDAVIWSGEDGDADTLNPRLRAAGANMERIHVVHGVLDDGRRHPFDPARDIELLWEALDAVPVPRLVIIDPVVAVVANDSHKNAEVRRSLQPLVDLAEAKGCAVLGVTHFAKGTAGRDPIERLNGSVAFGALARVVLVAAKREENGRVAGRVLLRAKNNLGPDGGGFDYELVSGPLPGHPEIEVSQVQWGAPVSGTARAVLDQAETVDSERSAVVEAMAWLRDTLESGPTPANEVLKLARLSGIADKALRTARERLGIKPKRSGFGPGSRVHWQLPTIDAQLPIDAHSDGRASMGSKGIYDATAAGTAADDADGPLEVFEL